MKQISKLFLSGLAAVIPFALTVYFLYWAGNSVEQLVGRLLKLVVPPEHYITGMGLVAGVTVLILIGLLLKAWLFRRLFNLGENLLARLPLVKTVYNSLRDLTGFLSRPTEREFGTVVKIDMGENMTLVGFLTQENLAGIHPELPADKVAVYLPMSYQIGGYMIMVPRESITPINMSVNDALRFSITAGMSGGAARE